MENEYFKNLLGKVKLIETKEKNGILLMARVHMIMGGETIDVTVEMVAYNEYEVKNLLYYGVYTGSVYKLSEYQSGEIVSHVAKKLAMMTGDNFTA